MPEKVKLPAMPVDIYLEIVGIVNWDERMDNKYIKLNIFPIISEVLFVLTCLLFQGYYIYINFLFYIVLAIYFLLRKDFSIKEWLASVKGGSVFWKQVMWTILFFCLAFVFTNILENMFPFLSTGMINLKADNWLKLILFTGSTIILPPIVEEMFYRKNLTSFKNGKILILTTIFSMFLYALEHTFTIWGIFLCMIWALPLSISYIKTKNIYVTMTAHFICNFVINGIAVVEICGFLLS
ncbi:MULTISPECIES: CPBP family intramembrane glutamic endopeptidase [Terrabacteria group]|uniref:CPBP family intramembrane glutamic endopeptidase n=1 Tax=Bacillati TaxID=1783272 RepID=UPI001C6E551E|nr:MULTISPECIES: CPBP family intramembrane glutamic endopeptidase [Terrabacteria group]MBW9213140.1 CPBP family intramembrane metalloprotease [Trueperella sp. zg.1013]